MESSRPARSRRTAPVVVLLVDDETSSRMVLGAILNTLSGGAEVIAFDDPMQALVWAHRHSAHAVVTDFHMPHMDGAQLIAELRKLPGFERSVVVVVSASEHGDELALAAQAGADLAFRKPVRPHELLAALEQLLTERSARFRRNDGGSRWSRLWRRLRLWRLP
jgi:CheY-like chemotaxis protein